MIKLKLNSDITEQSFTLEDLGRNFNSKIFQEIQNDFDIDFLN